MHSLDTFSTDIRFLHDATMLYVIFWKKNTQRNYQRSRNSLQEMEREDK